MARLIRWYGLLTKRLFKRPTFIAILLLIPALVLGYSAVAAEDSGVVTVALAQEDNEDAMASAVTEKLMDNSNLIRFISCISPEEAEHQVLIGKADAAWIFEANMEKKVYKFVSSRSAWDAFVRVVERESNISVMLTREKLSGAIFDCCSEVLYLQYIRENVREMDGVSDEELLRYYNAVTLNGELFDFSYTDDSAKDDPAKNYLMTPVRGMLAVVIVLCGLATAMYYIQDQQSGTFAWMAERKRPLAELGCQMISVVNISFVALISLAVIGQTVDLGRELAVMALYAPCTAVFSMTVRRLIGGMRGLGTLLPLLVVVMFVVCPVFFDLSMLRVLQYCFPPTYFINAAYNDKFLLYMSLYTIALGSVYFLLGKVLKRK